MYKEKEVRHCCILYCYVMNSSAEITVICVLSTEAVKFTVLGYLND